MRNIYLLLAALCIGASAMAQTDSTNSQAKKEDTIRIGSLIIIKKGDGHYQNWDNSVRVTRQHRKSKNVSTNWVILDLGFSNFSDKTNYLTAATAGVVAPGVGKEDFSLRNGKSINVNIWLFMQRLNLINHVVNLKYGLGIELNNYRYESNIWYDKPNHIFRQDNARHYEKNKLAADYVTMPLMLNFNFTPNSFYNRSFGFSAGVSAGYLYNSRQKMITVENGKQKTHDEMYMRPFKISYVAELQLGPVKLYGSLATQSMFEKGLDQTPYNLGLRFSNW